MRKLTLSTSATAVLVAAAFLSSQPIDPPSNHFMQPMESRSGRWPKVQREWLELHPSCAACGTSTGCQVHHIKSFRDYPELELNPNGDNLITLCGPEGHNCHFSIGHMWNYNYSNPNVVKDCERLRKSLKESRENGK